MSKRVRPVTPLNLPRLKFSGSARRLGDFQRVQGGGRIDLPAMRLLGNAAKHGQTGNRFANGTATLPKLKMGSGAALAIRRSKGQGISQMPLRGVALIGSVLRIDSEAATVQLFNAQGNPSGAGPSSDPEGVFYGDTSLVAGDVWWVDQVPANCTVTAFPGGAFTVVATAAVATGPYQFRVNLRRGINGVRSAFMKDFVVSTSQIYVNAANPTAGNGTIGNPYKTIQAAENVVIGGAAVIVAPGTYAEQVTVSVNNTYWLATGGAPGVYPAILDGGQTLSEGFLVDGVNVLIDGFKCTGQRGRGLSIRGPGITFCELRNCWTYDTGSSGIMCQGATTDPFTNGNWRGIQNLNIHHCVVERACNTGWTVNPSSGFNEHLTLMNGIYNFSVHHCDIGVSSVTGPGYEGGVNGGEGLDCKEGCDGGNIYSNRCFNLPRNPMYMDAGHSSTASGYTRPGFVKNIHIYNNLIYATNGHGIFITSEAQTNSAADPVTGRLGGSISNITVDYNTVYGVQNSGFLLYDRNLLTAGFTLATVPLCDGVRVVNNIFHGNNLVANGNYSGITNDHEWGTNVFYTKNVSTGNGAGIRVLIGTPTVSGTINSDPLFTNQGAADFTLTATSPARNVAGNALVNPTTDFAGNPRPFGAAPDCGAYERQS